MDRVRPPRIDVLRPLTKVVAAVAIVASLAFLPLPPAARSAPRQVAIQAALEKLREQLEASAAAEAVQPDEAAELARRADELEERLLAGDPVVWADVDALNDARRQEEAAQRSQAANLTQRAASLADDLELHDALDAQELATIAELAESLGMTAALSPELRELLDKLERVAEKTSGTSPVKSQPLDAEALREAGLDVEELKRLAEALQQMGGTRLRHAARDGSLSAPELSELRKLLEGEGRLRGNPAASELQSVQDHGGEFDPTPREGDEGGLPGRGGIGRGRSDAALDHAGDTELDTSKLRPERLAPGTPIPDKWQELRVVRAEPITNPGEQQPGGGTAGDGSGRATFHRELAPRHRDAVQRFFSPTPVPRGR